MPMFLPIWISSMHVFNIIVKLILIIKKKKLKKKRYTCNNAIMFEIMTFHFALYNSSTWGYADVPFFDARFKIRIVVERLRIFVNDLKFLGQIYLFTIILWNESCIDREIGSSTFLYSMLERRKYTNACLHKREEGRKVWLVSANNKISIREKQSGNFGNIVY